MQVLIKNIYLINPRLMNGSVLQIFCPSKVKVQFFWCVFVSLPDLHNSFSELGAKTMQTAIFLGSGYLHSVKIAVFFNDMLFTLSANSYRFYLHHVKIARFSAIYTTYCK